MTYFTWKEEGLTKDCDSLDSMAARFEESARLETKLRRSALHTERILQIPPLLRKRAVSYRGSDNQEDLEG